MVDTDRSEDGYGIEQNKGFNSRDDDTRESNATMSGVVEDIRHFDAICYEDVRLLVVRSAGSGERDVLAMEVTLAHYKGHETPKAVS